MIIETKVGKKTLLFDDEKHKFWFENGTKKKDYVPSVTSFTSVIDKSAALVGWAVKLTKTYLVEKLNRGEQLIEVDIVEACRQHHIKREEAADVGKQIHDLVEKWIHGKELGEIEDDRVRNGFEAFLRYQQQQNVKWQAAEMIVYSKKYDYAGITDAVGEINGELVLVDFKSANSIYPEHVLQAAGYQLAYEEMTGKKIAYRLIIRFGKEDGSFEVRRYEDGAMDKKAFLACLMLKNRLKELNGNGEDS